MKIQSRLAAVIIAVVFTTVTSSIVAQEKGNKNVTTVERDVPAFTGIEAGGALKVYISKGEVQSVKIETDENLQQNVMTKVDGDILQISSKGIKNPTKLNAYIVVKELKSVKVSGASTIQGESLFETNDFKVTASGASSVQLDLDVTALTSVVSGAADVTLSGRAKSHKLSVSGAGKLSARGLVTETVDYDVSGAGDARLNVTEQITGKKSGAGRITYVGNPKNEQIVNSDVRNSSSYAKTYDDSTKVKVGKMKVEVYEGRDSVKVVVGNRELVVDDEGNVKLNRNKRIKFNGHWAGFDMGLNGYFDPDFKMSFPKETEYMDLQNSKSWVVNVNFFEQNISLSKNQHWGMLTGMGFSWNNYRFSKDTRLNADSSQLIGYVDKGVSIRKSKLTALYFDVPLLFEYQTNSYQKKNSFHLGAGMIMGVRLSSHTKKYYDERNKTFDIYHYNTIQNRTAMRKIFRVNIAKLCKSKKFR